MFPVSQSITSSSIASSSIEVKESTTIQEKANTPPPPSPSTNEIEVKRAESTTIQEKANTPPPPPSSNDKESDSTPLDTKSDQDDSSEEEEPVRGVRAREYKSYPSNSTEYHISKLALRRSNTGT